MPKRFLIESSVARAAIGFGSPAQHSAVREKTTGGQPATSTYLRMEFIRGVVCAMAHMATVVRNFDTCKAAFSYLSQDFSQRDMKVYVQVAGMLLDRSVPQTPSAWAEVIAREAVQILRRFDSRLKDRIKNKSKCQIGGRTPAIDYNTLVDDLNSYCREFLTPVTDCEINDWLDLTGPRSEVSNLISQLPQGEVAAVDQLRDYQTAARHITCSQCIKIGDAVIALEQPVTAVLVYSDAAFDTLCPSLGKPGVKIPSAVAAERAANPNLPPL